MPAIQLSQIDAALREANLTSAQIEDDDEGLAHISIVINAILTRFGLEAAAVALLRPHCDCERLLGGDFLHGGGGALQQIACLNRAIHGADLAARVGLYCSLVEYAEKLGEDGDVYPPMNLALELLTEFLKFPANDPTGNLLEVLRTAHYAVTMDSDVDYMPSRRTLIIVARLLKNEAIRT